MSVVVWPDHLLSVADWEALPEDSSRRCELVEGGLYVRPRPVFDHQRALLKLGPQIDDQLPSGLVALPEVEVVLFEDWPATVRIPDLIVVSAELAETNPARCSASDVLLAVEVVSRGSVRTDRIVKFAEYADAGIPDYWVVDLEKPTSIAAFTLKNGHYVAVGESAARFSVDSPVVMDLDPATLLPRR